MAEICNGMVSGLDKAFQVDNSSKFTEKEKSALINVVKAKNLNKYFSNGYYNYILFNGLDLSESDLKSFPNIETHLLEYRDKLNKRYSYRKSIPFWEWSFLRNKNHIEGSKSKILVPCKERFDKKHLLDFH
jgi:adenine-specific DNA-methyltransferase